MKPLLRVISEASLHLIWCDRLRSSGRPLTLKVASAHLLPRSLVWLTAFLHNGFLKVMLESGQSNCLCCCRSTLAAIPVSRGLCHLLWSGGCLCIFVCGGPCCKGLCPLKQTWLILPVVICLSQRLSHACLSISFYTVKPRMAH